jgi:hypothetical protein
MSPLIPEEPLKDTGYSSGKDEMNFAEFPIALLSDRVPEGQKSLKFEDQFYDERRKKVVKRRRIIEGSEEFGLPTAIDDVIVLALIQLTKQKNDFKRQDLEFTRLELIRMLGWKNEGRNYERLALSLHRLANVTYHYINAWYDNRQGTWTTKIFHILDTVEINDSRASDGQGGLFPSRIVWNEVIFDSFRANFVRNLDFHLCMRLEHSTALRMYRFLGKRFYLKPDWTFDLKEFANVHIGLGRNYEGGTQIARKLKPAISELENVGFLEPLNESERFPKNGRAAELTQRGVTAAKAARLTKQYPADAIRSKLEVFDWMREMKDKRIAKNPAGYLVKSVEEDYAAPPGFESLADRQRRQEARKEQERAAASERRRRQEEETRQEAERKEVDAYIKRLDPAERMTLQAEALAQATPEARQNCNDPSLARFRDTLMLGILREYVGKKLKQQQMPAEA